jgi:hypothetical protein
MTKRPFKLVDDIKGLGDVINVTTIGLGGHTGFSGTS